MDWSSDRILRRVRSSLSTSVQQLSRNRSTVRRLYGALFLLTAIILGVQSQRSIEEKALARWLSQNTPSLSMWRTLAESRGLNRISETKSLAPWNRHAPRDLSAHSAWWDDQNHALWIILKPESETSYDSANLSIEIHLFTQTIRPQAPSSTLRPLGFSWTALKAFEKLQIPEVKLKPEKLLRKPLKKDPRLWIF